MVSVHEMQLLEQLLDVTKQISMLVFDQEESLEQLTILQATQDELREQLDQLGFSAQTADASAKAIIAECFQLEQSIQKRLQLEQNMIKAEINKLQAGNLMKNRYQQAYSQVEGYFIDNKK
ncbi:hypothetical protein [Paenibacillus tyrfis]|uniref:Flagellar protein FliT n=1 Tax=Paenibacillus tyrfis TaxID=1501230 RepID=A0A081P3K2_9BACL|nr:hypothetical protein [Paenibacillus tyrfis]KEQ25275.1 hypothetical protein ET33_04245 [Paenibacillus tyrfis]